MTTKRWFATCQHLVRFTMLSPALSVLRSALLEVPFSLPVGGLNFDTLLGIYPATSSGPPGAVLTMYENHQALNFEDVHLSIGSPKSDAVYRGRWWRWVVTLFIASSASSSMSQSIHSGWCQPFWCTPVIQFFGNHKSRYSWLIICLYDTGIRVELLSHTRMYLGAAELMFMLLSIPHAMQGLLSSPSSMPWHFLQWLFLLSYSCNSFVDLKKA